MSDNRLPNVEGPLTGGRGWPFGSPAYDLADHGCVIEEFIFSGEATAYRPVSGSAIERDGRWETEPSGTASYRSRMYVVRPADPARFNGVVLVNWQNVTAGIDIGVPSTSELDHGFAWVGVTTQRIAMTGQEGAGPITGTKGSGLPDWDPERYGTLHHPGDEYSYDMFSQAGRAVSPGRSPMEVDPLGGLEPRLVLATGGSQSAMRLGSYINIAHQRDRVFDGFLATVHMGICPHPPDQPLLASAAPLGDGFYAGSSRIRTDAGTPILVLCSESETGYTFPVRQPDTDTFRFWEMAGASHTTGRAMPEMEAVFARDGIALPAVLASAERNATDWTCISEAALAALVEWVDSGTPPRSFRPIEVDPGSPPVIRRDEFGNATGGIRLPEVTLPTGNHFGAHPTNPAGLLSGLSVLLDRSQLEERFGTREGFEKAWDAAVDELASSGLVLPGSIDEEKRRGRAVAMAAWSYEPDR